MANLLLKSLCLRGKDDNDSEAIDPNLKKKLRNLSIPKVRTNQVYKTSIFEFNRDYEIKTVEKTFMVQGPYLNISILDSNILDSNILHHSWTSHGFQKILAYSYLHIGLVQVAVKPLTKLSCDLPILICLRDKRMLRFHESVIAVLESNLQNGPTYFNCFPSYPVCLKDPHVTKCLDLDINIPSEKFMDGIPPVTIMYRFCYKVTNNVSDLKALKSYTANETEVIAQNSSSKVTRKILKHDQIVYPEEYLQRCSS